MHPDIRIAPTLTLTDLRKREASWNELVDRSGLGVAHRLDWLETLREVNETAQHCWVTTVMQSDVPIGFAPLFMAHETWHGLPIRALLPVPLLNQLHGTQFITNPDHLGAAVRGLVGAIARGKPRWDVWNMMFQVGEPQALVFEDCLRDIGLSFDKNRRQSSPFLPLPATWDELAASLQSRFRTTVRSRERNLRQQGTVEVRFHAAPNEVDDALAAIAEIEAASWKQDSGLPITSARHWEFYRRYAHKAAARGALMIPVLYFNGVPIAFDYGATDKGTYYLLQTSYKKETHSLYPGTVLRKLVIERLIADGFTEIDFGTGDSEWKAKWTQQKRCHDGYTVFGRTVRGITLATIRSIKRRAAGSLPPNDSGRGAASESS